MNLQTASRFHQDEELGSRTLHCTWLLLQQHPTYTDIIYYSTTTKISSTNDKYSCKFHNKPSRRSCSQLPVYDHCYPYYPHPTAHTSRTQLPQCYRDWSVVGHTGNFSEMAKQTEPDFKLLSYTQPGPHCVVGVHDCQSCWWHFECCGIPILPNTHRY